MIVFHPAQENVVGAVSIQVGGQMAELVPCVRIVVLRAVRLVQDLVLEVALQHVFLLVLRIAQADVTSIVKANAQEVVLAHVQAVVAVVVVQIVVELVAAVKDAVQTVTKLCEFLILDNLGRKEPPRILLL